MKISGIDTEFCNNCEKNEAAEERHPCPFLREIYEDEKTLCNCCEECESQCREDI